MPRVMDDAPLSSVEIITVRQEGEPLGTVVIPVRDHVNAGTVASLLATHWPGNVDKRFMQGSVLTLNRNAGIQMMRGDWLVFIDDDMVWKPDALQRLLDRYAQLEADGVEVDVLAALFCRRQEPYQPVLYMREGPTEGRYNFLETWEDGAVIEVDATGMAFTLITRRCLERLSEGPMPSYEERVASDRHPDFFRWTGALGEDLRFCQDVKHFGGRILVDTSIPIGHVGEKAFGIRDYWAQVALRSPEDEARRRDVNLRMELPTLTAREARGRLGW